MNLANHRKNKAASGVAPVLTPALRIFCRNSCTGSAKVSNTIKLPRITLLIALNVGLARGFARNIPLVQYFRQEKAEIAAIRQEEKRAAEAKARFEARQARLEREKAARLERHKSAAVQPAAKDKDAIAAALARVKEKQAQATQPIVIKAGERPDNSAIIAAREARKAQARAKQAELQQTNDAATVADPRKTAVEAAIARAKARKLEQQQANAEPEEQVDPRKAAVEAAIARAKARKLEQQQTNAEPEEQVDPRKAAVAAAIARAQAKKAAQQKVVNED